jgi:tetratricopeptide (TPR) repeat protein
MKPNKSDLTEVDLLIRIGDHQNAKIRLNLVLHKEIPREYLAEIASLTRRLSRSEIGLALLNPIVRPPATKHIVSTEAERAEYAACLIRLGILKEAHTILDTVTPDSYPRSLIFRAFSYIAQWDFEKSETCLNEFIKKSDVHSYEVLIAKVNLAVGYVFLENFKKGNGLLDELSSITLETKNLLLYSNVLELKTQMAILSGRYSQADKILKEATQILISSETIDAYFLKKDQAILNFFKSFDGVKLNFKPSDLEDILIVKKEAKDRNFWEQARDCDYYLSCATKNIQIIKHLYFGTPFESYRKKLLSKVGLVKEDLIEAYSWQIGSGKKNQKIDAFTNESQAHEIFLNKGQVPYRVLKSLAVDFYRPRRVMEIFESVFPKEHYFPKYSADKIYQGLKRLRHALLLNNKALIISEQSGFYQLNAQKNFTIELVCPVEHKETLNKSYLNYRRNNKLHRMIQMIEKKFRNKYFTSGDFLKLHHISERSAVRHLKNAVEKGLIKKFGNTRFAKYKLN